MKKILTRYKNGNYNVILCDDGTKIRYNDLDNLIPAFAESIDCNITEKCDGNCQYCYLGCNENGKHADLNQPFFDTLHKGQELALNGNDLSHPQLMDFLVRMKKQGVICNLTVNQKHFIKHKDAIKKMAADGLIYGIGISLVDSADKRLYKYIEEFPNAVIHTIAGLLTENDIKNLTDKDIKLLILGYKVLGRGDHYFYSHEEEIREKIKWLGENIISISKKFQVVSFDNLAIEQLDLKERVDSKTWDHLYMGDEGEFTFYIDAVRHKFAESSLQNLRYELLDNVDDMFAVIRDNRSSH